ncbi:DUF6644 family protein [Pseudomonas cremoricolorata]|uniref:DUF6644 family protein n=1 Tax=Pseudomonas cremoricolorata TaxID=157783 RepID=UPI000428EE4C|nr:DUF6644 family protein [Pseudomonas cremoricolorata]
MSSLPIVDWLYATPVSSAIRDLLWVVPSVQSLHIIAIAVIFASAVLSDLRLAGLFARDLPTAQVIRRYYPWMRGALLVLLASGLVMAIGEPDRVLVNSVFWLKMALVVVAFMLAWQVRRPFLRSRQGPGNDIERPGLAPLAWLSMGLWCVVIFCGRWIAYAI